MKRNIITSTPTKDESAIRSLYEQLIKGWNEASSDGFANLFAENGSTVGFDGSQANGRKEIQNHLSAIFANHKTARYVTIIREIRILATGVGLLRSAVGMVPPGRQQINPATNAIQSLIAVMENGDFKIALFQNTPAAFHGREQEAENLTNELQAQLEKELQHTE